MPNRGELPSPAQRARNAAVRSAAIKPSSAMPDAEAWTIIAFCAIGWLMTFYFALSSVGVDAFPQLMAQVPMG
jgi:hypothetical protein